MRVERRTTLKAPNEKRKRGPRTHESGKLGIIASILVARHLKSENELMGYSASPRTESLIASAIRVAERILTKIDRLED